MYYPTCSRISPPPPPFFFQGEEGTASRRLAMETNAGESFQMKIFFNIFARICLHCKAKIVVSSPILRIRIWSIRDTVQKSNQVNSDQMKCCFLRRGENRSTPAEKKPPRGRIREPTNSTHMWRRVWESNPGHIGVRRLLLPLSYPCTPREDKTREKPLGVGARFSNVPKLCWPFLVVTILSISHERRGFKSSNFTASLLFTSLKTC